MNILKSMLAVCAMSAVFGAYATPPIEYNAAVRNSLGEVVANKNVNFTLEITDAAVSGNVLYRETSAAQTDEDGMALLMIGEGTPSQGDYDSLSWDAPRYLSVTLDLDGSHRPLGTIRLLGVPVARQAKSAGALQRKKSSGEVLELCVNNLGELSWQKVEGTGSPAYDQDLVPENLYFIGTFNNWTIADAIKMEKLSKTRFAIDRALTTGEIFKFTAAPDWNQPRDWSGTDCKIGEPVPLREFQNTPAFPGPDGDYRIIVDFYDYTLTIKQK